jgi:hypothetical protein
MENNNPEKKFQNNFEAPELQRRKQELAKIRELYKPIDPVELREHAQLYDEMKFK